MGVKLTVKDKRILFELDSNSRQSISQIAKKVGLSRDIVNYRLNQLVNKGVIGGFYTVIDVSKLGFLFCRIFLRFQKIDPRKEEEIIQYCKQTRSIGWLYTIDNRWNLVFAVYVKSIHELEEVYDSLTYKYGDYLAERSVSIATKIYHFRHNYLFGTDDFSEMVLGGAGTVDVDPTDLNLLKVLSPDARLPLIEVAKKVNLTPNAAKYRINRLIKSCVILGFRAKLDTKLLGYEHYKVFLFLENTTKKLMAKLTTYLRFHPNVIYITKAIGASDLEFEAMLRNRNELHELMRELRSKFSNILKDYETMLLFEEVMIGYY
ncbi:Lrp/AsnC family transcriptional regulator [Candidatus Woesearchaeota archaeon]|nr:Lrp/AsnC family transcriptional regulator [Candidatus Woesearchaeota archaeon]